MPPSVLDSLPNVHVSYALLRNRCHKKGIAGKLDLAMQWAVEQEEAGGEVNFKEGLAFYSSIGILQVIREGQGEACPVCVSQMYY